MEWETDLLGRKIGLATSLDRPFLPKNANQVLRRMETKARTLKFELLVSRIDASRTQSLWAMESAGFLLVDVGVTFRYELDSDMVLSERGAHIDPPKIREATRADIPALQKIVTGLFLTSYYYVSPFFSKGEADLLFRTWISNCVTKAVADKVLLAHTAHHILGFVTCRALANKTGVIDLLGVHRRYQSRGVGRALINAALEFFKASAVRVVRVRTQITNTASVNLYASTGSCLSRVDATFMKSLKE